MGDVGEDEIPGFTWSKPVVDLGMQPNWPELDRNLTSSGVESVWIKDEASRKRMDVTRKGFDLVAGREAANREHKILHSLAVGGNDELMRRLLSLGLNPDVVTDTLLNTPSHTCGRYAFVACVELLALCRANPAATNAEGLTPAQRTETFFSGLRQKYLKSAEDQDKIEKFANIRAIWDMIRLFGPPPLAQLACNRQWWAVKNLCRRKAVDLDEVLSKYRGKDTVEWALFHGANDLADEIKYLFGYPASDQSSGCNPDDTKGMLQELVVTLGEKATAFEEEIKKLDSRMRAQEGRTPGSGPSIRPQSQMMDFGQLVSMAHPADENGNDPVIRAVDFMLMEIRSKAVDSDQKLTVLSELGALLKKLKSA